MPTSYTQSGSKGGEIDFIRSQNSLTAAATEMASVEKAVKELPGGYGLPYIGAFKDRLSFYWFEGEIDYFKSRMEKYKSSVYRVNFAPGPPGFPDPRGVVVLDQPSFATLMDNTKVDKTNTLIGPYMPDLAFTGGYRPLPYLDTSEEKHTLYKNLMFDIFRTKSSEFFPQISKAFEETSGLWESTIAKSGKVELLSTAGNMVIKYLFTTITGQDPALTLGKDPHTTFQTWAGVQFAGVAYTNLPHFAEETLMHSFRLPFFPVKKQYEAIVGYFKTYGTEFLDVAESRYNLDRDEALHSLVFSLGINTRLGLLKMLPPIVYYLSKAGPSLQGRLAKEVRSVLSSVDDISATTLMKLPLVRSTVLEVLRLMPSIFYAFGRAREDLIVESHEAKYKVKKGELIGTHLYFVMRDPVVFKNPHEFDPERFMGKQGEALLPYLVWSNGRETDTPTATNKQCPGKYYAELFAIQFIANMFLKYDSFDISPDSKISTTELVVYLNSLTPRT